MTRVSLTHRITKIGGKAVSVAVCALTGLVLFGAAGSAFATPVVYFQTIADGRSYFDSTVTTYAVGGTPDLLTTTLSGLGSGTNWSIGGIDISATNGVTRSVNNSYLSSAPSLSGTPTGQGINMTASGSDPEGSGLTFHFTSTLNAFGVEMGDWGTCCYPSALYIQFGLNGAWGAAQQIGVANSRVDVPEDNGSQTFTFIGAVNDTNFFNEVRIYGAGNGDVLYAGGVLRTASVALNSVPSDAGSSTQGPSATDIDTAQSSYLASNLGTSVNPAFVGGTLQVDSAGATISSNFTVSNAGGTINANGYNSTFSGVISNAASSTGSMTFTGSGITALTNVNTYTGSTTINSGATLALSGSGSIAASSGVIDNGTFDISGTTSGATIKTLSGNGAVVLGARTLTLSNAAGTFAGVVGGSGGLSVTGGSETLTGANTYTGATSVGSGATLTLSGAGSLASNAINIASGGTFNDSNGGLSASANVTDNGTFTLGASEAINQLDGSGAVGLGSHTLTLNQGSFGGVIGGTGGLVKAGAGTLTLSGTNTYSGGTTVNGGTVAVSSDANLGNAAGPLALDNGTLHSTASFTTARATSLTGTGTLTTDAGTTLQDTGAVSGTGALLKDGAGTLQLCGDVSNSGGASVAAGRLDLCGNYTAPGAVSVASGATLGVTGTTSLASSSGITNDGTLDISGTSAGTTAQTVSGSGNIALGSQTLTLSNAAGTLSGIVGGSGGLSVTGGSETLTGANTYTGATSVGSGATLTLSGAGSLASNAINIASGGTFNDSNGGLSASANVTDNGTFTLGASEAINQLDGSGAVGLGSHTLTLNQGSFGGVIGGTGGLVKAGAGTLTLSGTNTYSGGTTVNGGTVAVSSDANLGSAAGPLALNDGTLHTTASFTTARATSLTGTGTLTTDAGTTLQDSGAVSGTGALLKDGAGTLQLCGDVSNSGGASVAAGRLDLCGNYTAPGAVSIASGATLGVTGTTSLASSSGIANSGTLDISGTSAGTTAQTVSGSGNIALGSQTLTLSNAAGTLSGIVGGSGGLSVTGGSETLTGANTYTGATSVGSGATLTLSGAGSLASNAINIASGGTFNDSNGGLSASANVTDNGTFTLGASEAINQLDGSGAVGLGSHTLTLNQGSFGGVIGGTGGLVKAGAGTLTLSGTNTYSGGTTVTGGTVAVSSDANLGSAAGPLALNDGTLHTTASFTTARATSLTGTGTLTTDAGTTLQDTGAVSGTGALLKNGAGTLQLCGDVSNSGGASVAAGRLDLCGNYTAPGAVSIASGATVALVGTTSLGSASGLANDGTLDISGTTSSLGSTITALTGGGEVVLGNRNLNLSNASGNFGGVISGTGGVAVKGGSQTFSGANTYTGATTIDSGATLALNGAGTAGVASTLVNNGSFDVSGSAAGASIATVVGSGNVILGSQSLTLSNASGNFDGVISGTGGLNVTSGVVALGGVSTYTGGTTIGNGATVRVSSDANLGGAGGVLNLNGGTLQSTSSFSTARDINVTGTGTLQANNGTTLSGSGVVSGSGTLVKNGAGAVILSGDLAHTGGTVVNQGSLQLAGTNSYTGGTTLNGGTLKVASDASLGAGSSAITFNGGTLQATTSFSSARDVNATGGGTVATDAGATLSLTGSLVGTGQLNKTGAGTLVLSGDSSGDHTVGSGWTGGMIVNGGLVQVTNAWGLGWGNVTVNGGTVNTTVDILTGQSIILAGNTTVNVDTGTTTTLSGTITDTGSDSGGSSGCFVKSGLGTLNLTGVMTQSNGTCVQQGELRANGTLDSVVSVDSPAILRGTGLVNGPISVHGILAPGNSPGTLTTTGTVTMLAGSSFQADINGLGTASGPGNYSRLLVTGAGNQFVAGGATLAPNLTAITGAVTYTPYVPQLGDTFRIITADGGISGRFAPLAQPDGMATGTRMAVFYDVFGSNSVNLRVIPTSYASGVLAVNGNARALGAAVDRIVTADQLGTATTAQGQLVYTLAGLNAAQLPGVMTALSGEVHAALAAAAPRAGQWTQGAIGRQLGSGSSRNAADSTDLHDHRALWIEMGANRGQWSSDSTSSGFRTDRTQFAIGGDVASTANARLGVGFSHASSNLAMSGVSASGSMDENLFFGYGQYRTGGYAIDGMLGYGSSTWESTRVDPIAGAGSLKTHQRGENWLAGLAVRKPVELLTTVVEPFVRTLFQQTTRGDVSEGSASTAALSLDKYSANGFRAMVGVAAGSIRKDPLSAPYTYQAEIGVGQDSGNAVRPTLRASLAGESFTVAGPQVGRSFGQIGVSGTLRLAPQVFAYIGLTGEARSGQSDIGGNLGVRVAF